MTKLKKNQRYIQLILFSLIIFTFFTPALDTRASDISDAEPLTRIGILEETNHERTRRGLDALEESTLLHQIADARLNDMFERDYFGHVAPTGEDVNDTADEYEYASLLLGENLAFGIYQDDEDVVDAWMESPGHRENILEKRYTHIGIATK